MTARAELIKVLTLPATWLTLLGTLFVTVVLDVAFIAAAGQGQTGSTSALDVGLASIGYAQAGFLILGVLTVTSEYGGQVFTSLTAVPRRLELQVVKGLILVAVSIPAAILMVTVSTLLARLALPDAAQAGAGELLGAIGGATVYLALTTLLAAAVAVAVRRSLPAVALLLGYYFILGPYVRDRTEHASFLPDTAGYSLWFPGGAEGAPSPAVGFAVVLAWSLVAFAAATAAFVRRDA
ncbi:hypothetical protein AB0M02_21155 [Actinoplanes sp. NPDC051861]|uniref:hypothetical protein n=1 Tax=Actinoplanes sp. NPDC051861 TaxID=3155170 RepID=UPI00343930AA